METLEASSPLVLLTGGTGFVGFRILVQALSLGYDVRLAVRSIANAKSKLLQAPSLSGSALVSNVSFVEVPDIVTVDAYNEAIKGVDYVIHCASPLASPQLTDYENQIIKPAIAGTIEMLKAAASEPSVKRVVVTSSVAANRAATASPEDKINARTRIPTPKGPFGSVMEAYSASKVAALNSAEEWIAREKPNFETVHIMPAFVIGQNELASRAADLLSGTAGLPIIHLVAPDNPWASISKGGAVDVRDVAEIHVRSLDAEKIEGNRAYGISQPVTWQDAFGIVKKHFPKAVENGVFKDKRAESKPPVWDASETEDIFGTTLRTFEESTSDVAGQWLELLGKEKA